jgi:hypothetical protein
VRELIPLGVALLTTAVFLPTLGGSFLNWDDNVNFLGNPSYRGLGREEIRWAFTSVLFGHYIPLTRLTWSLNYVFGGMDPWGYHLVNVLHRHAVSSAWPGGCAAGADQQLARSIGLTGRGCRAVRGHRSGSARPHESPPGRTCSAPSSCSHAWIICAQSGGDQAPRPSRRRRDARPRYLQGRRSAVRPRSSARRLPLAGSADSVAG